MFRKRSKQPPRPAGNDLYIPRPIGLVMPVLNDLWERYGLAREGGEVPDAALVAALSQLLGPVDLVEVTSFLNGEMDDTYRSTPNAGGSFKAGLIEQGENTWGQLRLLPGWPTA